MTGQLDVGRAGLGSPGFSGLRFELGIELVERRSVELFAKLRCQLTVELVAKLFCQRRLALGEMRDFTVPTGMSRVAAISA